VLRSCASNYNQFVIRWRDRDNLRAHLTARDIGTEIHYPVPLHRQECFAISPPPGAFPAARAAATSLALPIYGELTEIQHRHVVHAIADFYAGS